MQLQIGFGNFQSWRAQNDRTDYHHLNRFFFFENPRAGHPLFPFMFPQVYLYEPFIPRPLEGYVLPIYIIRGHTSSCIAFKIAVLIICNPM